MYIRFIEFSGEIYLVGGITFEPRFDPPECFVAIHLSKVKGGITKAMLENDSVKIPFSYATEITDKDRIRALWILYGV